MSFFHKIKRDGITILHGIHENMTKSLKLTPCVKMAGLPDSNMSSSSSFVVFLPADNIDKVLLDTSQTFFIQL